MKSTKTKTERPKATPPDWLDGLRVAVKGIPKLSPVPTNEEIARAFNALKLALEK